MAIVTVGLFACKQTATLRYANGVKYQTFEYFLRKSPATGSMDTVRDGIVTIWDSSGIKVTDLHARNGVPDGVMRDFY